MDRLKSMEVFGRVVERRSFSAAARELGIPRSTVTRTVRHLEERLGLKLLERTTRWVEPTEEGRRYHLRCRELLALHGQIEAEFEPGLARGSLSIAAPGHLARHRLAPALPGFIAAQPGIELRLLIRERWEDLLEPDIDCALWAGVARDSTLVQRALGELEMVTCAAPGVIAAGPGGGIEGLAELPTVAVIDSRDAAPLPLSFIIAGEIRRLASSPGVRVEGFDIALEAAIAGAGVVQLPRDCAEPALVEGKLVQCSGAMAAPLPLWLLHAPRLERDPRVAAGLEWLVSLFDGAERRYPLSKAEKE